MPAALENEKTTLSARSLAGRIAVVDDDRVARLLLRDILEPKGYRVTDFEDGSDFVAAFEAGSRFDLVLSDMRMPRLSGDRLCGLLARAGAKAPPVILMSGSHDEENVGLALDSGARHFLRKPLEPGEVLALVQRCRRRYSKQARRPGGVREIGGHRILGVIGRGGMGVVYRARRPGEPDRALKVLCESWSEVEDQLRFRREVDLLSQVRHPGVARFVRAGVADDRVYYVMELIEGPTLHHTIGELGALPARQAARVGAAIAETLAHLHHLDICHRDVKPANIVLGPKQRPRLVDFGLARHPRDSALTSPDVIMGTPHFIAPERLTDGETTPAGDVFSLGVTLLVALVGRQPFADLRTPVQLADRYRAGGLPRPGQLTPGVPPALDKVITACCRVDARRRPTARQLAAALRELA